MHSSVQRAALRMGSAALALSIGFTAFASAASALTVSCAGAPTASNITWTSNVSGGIAPIAFLWSSGSTSSTQTIAVAPGTYTQSLQATDASSTIATTSCQATVAIPSPTISGFIATPATITAGQSSILSWTINNASTTSINNGVGTITATSVAVSPLVTTTYTLTAVSPQGTTSGSVLVSVNATSSGGTSVVAQIQALLAQIAALRAQILQLVLAQHDGGGTTAGTGTSTPATTTPQTCFNFHRDMHHGDNGNDVRELQRELSSDPTLLPSGLITGFFGHRTEDALKKFQKRFGMFSSTSNRGFFDNRTREFMREHCDNQDNDHDGIPNSTDTDDDNDGIPDVSDPHPFTPDVIGTSTQNLESDGNHEHNQHGKHGKNGEDGKNGKDGDSNDD